MICSPGISNFLVEISSLSPFCFLPPLFLYIVHLRRLSYLSFLFPGTLHSVGSIFPFLPCLPLLFFRLLPVKPPQTSALHFFSSGMVLVTACCITLGNSAGSSSGSLSTRSNPLSLSVASTVRISRAGPLKLPAALRDHRSGADSYCFSPDLYSSRAHPGAPSHHKVLLGW